MVGQLGVYELETIRVRLSVAEPTDGATGKLASDSAGAVRVLRPIFAGLAQDQEHLVMLALDCRNRVTGFSVIASGGQCSCDADPAILFRRALMLGAKGIILAHNHPSGDPTPSPQDIAFTDKTREGAQLLGLQLLDHIILTASGDYRSVND